MLRKRIVILLTNPYLRHNTHLANLRDFHNASIDQQQIFGSMMSKTTVINPMFHLVLLKEQISVKKMEFHLLPTTIQLPK